MRKPEGLKLGKFGLFGNINPADFLSKRELAEVYERNPSLREALGSPATESPISNPQPPTFPLPHFKATKAKRSLPVLNPETGLRDCTTCPAPCCMVLAAEITESEASSGKWEFTTEAGRHFLPRPHGRCVYLDVNNRCTTYAVRPQVCLSYRCDYPGKEDLRIAKWFVKNCV